MDYTITPVKPRSLVRRLAPWTAALGLFAGGGYGVYHYAAPRVAGVARPLVGSEAAAGETASDRLYAAMPGGRMPASEASAYAPATEPSVDRYAAAPTLPPALEEEDVPLPRDADAVNAPANPFSAAPAVSFSNRYGAPTVSAEPTAGAPAADETTEVDFPAEAAPEVARGQEPDSLNPLRSGVRAADAATEDNATEDARAVFAGGSPPAYTFPGTNPPNDGAAAVSDPGEADAIRYVSPEVAATAVGGGSVTPDEAFPGASSLPLAPTPVPADETSLAPSGRGYAAAATLPGEHSVVASAPLAGEFAPSEASLTPTPGLATADGTGRPGERLLEGLQTPMLTIQKLAPPEIQVGKRCTFAIRVQNNSQRTAHNVQVVDEVPLGTQLVGTAPKANVSGAQVVWDLGTLSAGEERIVEMELMPTEEGEVGSVATVTFASQLSAKTRCTRPQLALRLSANPRVMIGQQQIVQVEVTNPGSGDATGVMLLENIPQGVSHEAGPALEFAIGTLRPGETRRLDLVLQADAAGLVDNVMSARADASLQVQASCQFEVIAPELKVTVDGPQRRYLERPAKYTVSVDNPGTASAKEVQLVTQLPKGLQFVSANNMGEYDAATHSVYWSLAELPANQRGTVELTALPVEAGDHTLQIATRAAQGLEDRTEAHVSVEGLVALTFEVQDVEDAIEVGGETAYDIRVMNQGSKSATNVQVVALMPSGLRAQPGQGDARYVIQGDRVVFAPLAQLAPKANATFRFGVQGLRAGDQRVTLQVTTDEVRDPIIEVESTQVYADD